MSTIAKETAMNISRYSSLSAHSTNLLLERIIAFF